MHPFFNVGPYVLHAYSVCSLVAIFVGAFISTRVLRRCGFVIGDLCNLGLVLFVAAYVGAHTLYVLYFPSTFLSSPVKGLLSQGYVFHGGFFGAAIGLWIYSSIANKPFWLLSDTLLTILPVSHAIGRMGCLFAGCCYGLPTSRWFGILIEGQRVHPTPVYESFGNILIFFLLKFIGKQQQHKVEAGYISFLYLIFYGVLRFVIEFTRNDPRRFVAVFSCAQWFAIVSVALGTVFILKARKRKNYSLQQKRTRDEAFPPPEVSR